MPTLVFGGRCLRAGMKRKREVGAGRCCVGKLTELKVAFDVEKLVKDAHLGQSSG